MTITDAWDEAYELANDKNLAASQVFYAVVRARDESRALAAALQAAEKFMQLRTFDGEKTELEVFYEWLAATEQEKQ